MAIARDYQLSKANKELLEMQGRLNVLMGHYYNTIEPIQKATEERIRKENDLSHALADEAEAAKRAKEADDRRAKALDSLNAIAQDTNPETFTETLAHIEKMKEKELAQVEKIRAKYDDDPEVLQAVEEAQKRIVDKSERMATKVAEEQRKVWQELQDAINEQADTELNKAIKAIRKEYAELREEAERFRGQPVYSKLLVDLDEAEAIAVENAKLEENIKLIKEAEQERADAIETSGKFTAEIDKEVAAIDNEIDSLRKQNAELIAQKHISAEELNLIAKNIAGQVKLNKQKREALRLDKEQKKLAALSYVEYYGNILASSGNGYFEAVGQAAQAYGGARSSAMQYRQALKEGNEALAKDIKGQQIGSAVQATIKFGTDVWNAFSDSAKRSREALDEWNAKVADSAHQLALLTLEEFEYKQRNIFGVEDPYNKLQASILKEQAAQTEAAKALEKMANEGIIQTGTKKKAEGKTVFQLAASGAGAGALIGAAAGSGATPVGTIIGAAAGAITGAITGIFASRKEVAVHDSLKNKYGNIYDVETLEINKQILADYGKMDDATKRLIDNAKELLEVQKEARQEYEDYIVVLTGELGAEWSQTLLDAFRNKELFSAVKDFRDYLGQQIGQILHQQAYSAVFGNMFDSLQRQLTSIYNENGERVGSLDEALAGFDSRLEGRIGEYGTLIKELEEKMKGYGYKDIFGLPDNAQQEALRGTIAGMTEDTAGKINGNFMGLKLSAMEANSHLKAIKEQSVSHFAEVNTIMRGSLNALQAIAENTFESQITAKEMRDFMRRWDNDGLRVK